MNENACPAFLCFTSACRSRAQPSSHRKLPNIFPFNTIETDELLQLTFNSNLSCLCTNNISLTDLPAFEYISGINNIPNLKNLHLKD